jgi:hypothetical protein
MPREMVTTFVLSFLAFTLLFIALMRERYRLATLRDVVEGHEGEHA